MTKIEKFVKSLSNKQLEQTLVTIATYDDRYPADEAKIVREALELEYFERHGEEKFEAILDQIEAA